MERLLLSRIIDEGDLTTVLEARIDEEFFVDDEYRLIWKWVLEHWTRYSKAPSEKALKQNFPTFRMAEVPEPLAYYIDEIRVRRQYSIAQDGFLRASEALQNEDAAEALRAFSHSVQEAYASVTSLDNKVLNDEEQTTARLARYKDWARNPGQLRGMSTGFHTIDRATRGIQPSQYIALVGPQKSFKSTVLMSMGIHMNENENARILLVSFEMSPEEQEARHDCWRAGIDYNRLLNGRLTRKENRRLRETMRKIRDYEDFVLCSDLSAATTVSGIRAQQERVKPHITMIDGIYLMEDEEGEGAGTPQALTNISRGLRRMNLATKVPIVITTQVLEHKMSRKQGITAGSVGYTSAIGQDCTTMLGVAKNPDREGMSTLSVVLSRSGPLAKTDIEIDWEHGRIIEHQELVEEDDNDADAEEPANRAKW